jgi:putative endonuclease
MYVYIIKSKKNGRIYVGSTEDVSLRLEQHNKGDSKSTKSYVPWELIRSEEYSDKTLALKREKFFKSGKGRRALKNLLGLNNKV